MKKKVKKPPIELMKGKPRTEEEKFYARFSETQLNAVLLIILAATFMVQGMVKYLEVVGKFEFMKSWFTLILLALIFLVSSVVSISLGGIVSPLKYKREINLFSFSTFILGFIIFLISLAFLILII